MVQSANAIEVIAKTLHGMEEGLKLVEFINPDEQPQLAQFLVDAEMWIAQMRDRYDLPVIDQPEVYTGKNVIVVRVGRLSEVQRKQWKKAGDPQVWCWSIDIWDEGELNQGIPYGPHLGTNIGGGCTYEQFLNCILALLEDANNWQKDWIDPTEIWLTLQDEAYPREFKYKFGMDYQQAWRLLRLMSK